MKQERNRRFSRGDTHPETGRIYWGFRNICGRDAEYWMTPESFEKKKAYMTNYLKKRNKRKAAEREARYGPKVVKTPEERRTAKLESQRMWRINNPEKYAHKLAKSRSSRKANPVKRRAQAAAYKEQNPNYFNDYMRNRRIKDPMFAMVMQVRSRMRQVLNVSRKAKPNSVTKSMLGCDFDQLKEHIESQFRPNMSWGNRRLWHVDHVIPLSSAKTIEQLLSLGHHTNLKPLWVEENIKKGKNLC